MNQPLFNSSVRHQVYIEGLKANQADRFGRFLKLIDKSLRQRLSQDELTEFSRTRLEKLLSATNKTLGDIFGEFEGELRGDLIDFGEYESEFEAKNLSNAIDGVETIIPAPSQVKAAIFSQPLSVRGADGGKLIEPFIKDWTKSDRSRLIGAIRQGVFEGQTNGQIIRSLRGTKAANYTDGLLAVVDRHATAIVRTSVQHVSSVARFETWKQNPEVVKGYEWTSTLDGRTSTICRTLDGQKFELEKGPKPPAHIACRSTTVATLDKKFDFLDEGQTRASKDGSVDANQSYYQWLKDQPEEFQIDVLGPERAKLFRDGGLSAERFAQLQLGKNFRPLSLDDMRKKEPAAFKKAFETTVKVKPAAKVKKKKTGSGVQFDDSPAGQWHQRAFGNSRKKMQKIAEHHQDVRVTTEKSGAWARGGVQINMDKKDITERNAQNTWRHEFGHVHDARIGNKYGYSYISSSDLFKRAQKADGDDLATIAGRGRRKKQIAEFEAKRQAAYSRSDDMMIEAGSEGREKALRQLAKEAGLDFDKFWTMLKETTTAFDDADLSVLGHAARLGQMIQAVNLRDIQTFYRKGLLKDTGSFKDTRNAYNKDGIFACVTITPDSPVTRTAITEKRRFLRQRKAMLI